MPASSPTCARPVFLTGRSLGGALATVCSLELFLRLGLSRRDIFVSKFGAPKVGNMYFRKVCDACEPIPWRMVVAPDLFVMLPKLGYHHVGKKVLLTVGGDLFIDPNLMEMRLWSGDVASIPYHRKASYLLAMRAGCERHHGDQYLPEFWLVLMSKEDTRCFQHAMIRTGGTRGLRKMAAKRENIMRMDRIIDDLNMGGKIDAKIAVECGRLTELAIERQRQKPEDMDVEPASVDGQNAQMV